MTLANHTMPFDVHVGVDVVKKSCIKSLLTAEHVLLRRGIVRLEGDFAAEP